MSFKLFFIYSLLHKEIDGSGDAVLSSGLGRRESGAAPGQTRRMSPKASHPKGRHRVQSVGGEGRKLSCRSGGNHRLS